MERKKKLIGRVAKGETVIVECLAEDLMDQFDKMEELGEMAKRAVEADNEENTDETSKEMMLRGQDMIEAKGRFWIAVHERYGYWNCNVGIRDGYALVKMSRSKSTNGKDIFKMIMKDIMKKMEEDTPDNMFGVED